MRIALEDLKLDKLTLVYPGDKSYSIDEKIFVLGFNEKNNPEKDTAH